MIIDTPVVIIFYNRPEKLKKLFLELKKFKPQKLFLISDGAKNKSDIEKILKCRQLIEPNWKCKIYKNFSKRNLGCRKRVLTGLNWVFSKVDKAIIIEDDVIPSKDFFIFMKQLLVKYENNLNISSICSTNPLSESKNIKNSYFISKYFVGTGWATWKNRWNRTNHDLKFLSNLKNFYKLIKIFKSIRPALYYRYMLYNITRRKRDSWAITWTIYNFINEKKHIIPKHNLVSNIGYDLEATHRNNIPKIYKPYTEIKKKIFPLKYKINLNELNKFEKEVEDKVYSKSVLNRLSWFFDKLKYF